LRPLQHEAIRSTTAHDDDDIVPRLGRIRSRRSATRRKRYLHRVLRAVALAGGRARGGSPGRRSGFEGNRIGRRRCRPGVRQP
jgi:hypothetical protein